MPYYTPLRYPGGKRRLAPVVMRLLEENHLKDIHYYEAYAGGAAIALALLFEEYASTIHINDLSRPVYSFWQTVLNDNKDLCRRIASVKITMREWRKQREVYDRRDTADLADLGFATLFLNRANRSGIIDGGVIGGKDQSGEWGIDARFNKSELIRRIARIGRFSSRIQLYQLDALDFTNRAFLAAGPKSFAFYDPPYIENGEDLYLNNYDIAGHRQLAARVVQLQRPWIVTYDFSAVKHDLYASHRRIAYGLGYTAQKRYEGREVMFLSNGLKLPTTWKPSKRVELTPSGSAYPLFGKMAAKPHRSPS